MSQKEIVFLTMRNDDACKMVGIGTVQIKIFDDVVRDLTDVRYVPQMNKEYYLSWRCGVKRV